MTILKNTPYDRLAVGMAAEARRICSADDLYVFAHASGNMNPMHIPEADGDGEQPDKHFAEHGGTPVAW